ncbi:histidine kinase [Duganella sp. BJB488]|nr:histidine kinase [Duganella sp. BJB475]RFP17070.1 histidine kinase [Duganella sp. BJB488]
MGAIIMHKKIVGLCLGALLAATALSPASAQDRLSTRDEAVSFVRKAAAYLRQQGREQALRDFNNPKGPFVERELYIVVLDLGGTLLADGSNPRLVNKSLIDLRDVNGKYFVREELKMARDTGKGWVDFQWLNPVSKTMEARSSYFERVDDYIVLTGVYQQR